MRSEISKCSRSNAYQKTFRFRNFCGFHKLWWSSLLIIIIISYPISSRCLWPGGQFARSLERSPERRSWPDRLRTNEVPELLHLCQFVSGGRKREWTFRRVHSVRDELYRHRLESGEHSGRSAQPDQPPLPIPQPLHRAEPTQASCARQTAILEIDFEHNPIHGRQCLRQHSATSHSVSF